MKKLKRFLAGVLTFAMAMSLMTMTAFADQTTSVATIDENETGSLTIHKYEYNGNDGTPGTGMEGDTDTVPDDAEKLAGAGFTIYKVVDLAGLEAYYSTNPISLPAVSEYAENGAVKSTYASMKVGDEKITGNNGTVEFDNLALGIYLVVETTTPDAVTTKMDPFLVSIPMTTVDGESWLYDVEVFPKNKTSYGGVTLLKVDAANPNTKLQGVTFKLEKKNNDATWTEITKQAGASGDNTGSVLDLMTDATGLITVEGLTQGTYRFTEVNRGNNYGYIVDQYKTYEFTVNADGSVSYDLNSDGDTDDPGEKDANITITVTNDKPDFTKEVEDRTTSNWGQDSDYNVGDEIPYQLTIEVPTRITDLDLFTVTDTPNNLKYVTGSMKLTYGDDKAAATDANASTVATAAYAVAESGNGFTITFNPDQMADYAGKYIVVSYKSKLLDTAVTTTAGNPNEAKLEYNNIIDQDGHGQGQDVIKDQATIYTFKIQILKTAETSGGTPLEDVKFDLYKEVPQNTANAVAGDANNGLDSGKYWLKINTDSLVTAADGTVSYPGLANGTYYLVETKTNVGYNLLKEPVEVTLAIAYTTSITEATSWTVDVNGDATIVKHTINSASTTFTGTDDTDDTDGTDGIELVEIVNKTGFTLPTTGGMGTYVFVFVGVSMMAAAVILFITTKKKEASKEVK